jgi:hypothetical protein
LVTSPCRFAASPSRLDIFSIRFISSPNQQFVVMKTFLWK